MYTVSLEKIFANTVEMYNAKKITNNIVGLKSLRYNFKRCDIIN